NAQKSPKKHDNNTIAEASKSLEKPRNLAKSGRSKRYSNPIVKGIDWIRFCIKYMPLRSA
ncbi:hypothetical protein, partial [Chromobacterium fluminis]|uniref:hypothetical protein n=1 Tax=Chromobacterium fluminis TaxID=3044269 RepID=UPI0019809A40